MCAGKDAPDMVKIRLRNGHMASINKYVLEQIRAWAVEQYRMGEFDPPWPCESGATMKQSKADAELQEAIDNVEKFGRAQGGI